MRKYKIYYAGAFSVISLITEFLLMGKALHYIPWEGAVCEARAFLNIYKMITKDHNISQ